MALPRPVHQPDRPVGRRGEDHRGHAIIEQCSPTESRLLAHLPSKSFNANGAWLALATMAFNLTRALGVTAGGRYRRAETATIRAHLIHTPARVATSARRVRLHLPTQLMALGRPLAAAVDRDHDQFDPHATRPSRPRKPKWKTRTDRAITHARTPS